MSEPSHKCDNNAIFKQNYTQKLFISFKISYSCCFGFRENLEFPDFLQKKFYNIDYWKEITYSELTSYQRAWSS